MSSKRRAGGPIRQLSLQQSSRRPLKKQVSEDLSRPQVHGRGFKWDTQGDNRLTVLANSIASSGTSVTQERKPSKPRESQLSIVRPRPVKIAWSERRQLSQDADGSFGVEVVAQRCKGLPRPVTAKTCRTSLLSTHNDSILYSREQLAERLRVAWRERQESRPNLDIFLAHNSLDLGVNDEDILVSSRDCASSVSYSPVSASTKDYAEKIYAAPSKPGVTFPVAIFTTDHKQKTLLDINETLALNTFISENSLKNNAGNEISIGKEILNNDFDERISDMFVKTDLNLSECEGQMSFNLESPSEKRPSEITISIIPGDNDEAYDSCCDTYEVNSSQENPSLLDTEKNNLKEFVQIGCSNLEEKEVKETSFVNTSGTSIKQSIPASVRRVNFRNSSKATISGSLSVPCTPPVTPVPGATGNKPLSSRRPGLPLTRMMSAPVKGRVPTKVTESREKLLDNDGVEIVEPSQELSSDEGENDPDGNFVPRSERDRIKSAPIRRKFKSARRKGGKGRSDNSSDDEMVVEDKVKNKRGSARCGSNKNVDIVTMVSLLSPNESDIEDEPCDSVLQMASDTPRTCDERDDPANCATKSNCTSATAAFKATGIFCLRKTPKTVCFQQSGGPLTRSYTASYPSRRCGGSTLLGLAAEDKCLPVPPALSAPHPLTRKKIIKAKSIGPISRDDNNEEESTDQQTVKEKQEVTIEIHFPTESKILETETPKVDVPVASENQDMSSDVKEEKDGNIQTEPDFKTPKERECWDLYRKMMTKGVSISYDTVLRGMLTPTEYRQRKTAVFSPC